MSQLTSGRGISEPWQQSTSGLEAQGWPQTPLGLPVSLIKQERAALTLSAQATFTLQREEQTALCTEEQQQRWNTSQHRLYKPAEGCRQAAGACVLVSLLRAQLAQISYLFSLGTSCWTDTTFPTAANTALVHMEEV